MEARIAQIVAAFQGQSQPKSLGIQLPMVRTHRSASFATNVAIGKKVTQQGQVSQNLLATSASSGSKDP